MSVGVGGQPLGCGLQRGCGVVSERLAVAKAGDCDAEAGQRTERRVDLGAVDVEDAADDLPVLAARCGVAGEQHLVPGKVERDAARRMAGNGHGHGAVAEAEFVAVVEFAVYPGRHRRLRREPANRSVVDGLFPVGQVRWRPGGLGPDERRVGVVREHFYRAPARDVSRGADVIDVEVRQK